MAARLYQRGRIWWAWGYYADGKRWSESTRTRDKAAARLVADGIERDRAANDSASSEALSLSEAFRDVIAARMREGKATATIANYHAKSSHVRRLLGVDRDANTLTLADLEGYIDARMAEGAMRSTIDIELKMLKSALIYAARHGRYRGDIASIWPTDALRGAHVPHVRYLTRDEYARLAATLPGDRADWLAAYVYTGARRSEIWRVLASDVSLARNTMHIRGTKTDGADRVMPIAAELRPIVERRLRECGDGPLWPVWHEWDVLDRGCTRIGIDGVSANDLRRTFCSWLAVAGVPLLVTVRLMGHKSARMVERVYAHFGADDLQSAIKLLGGKPKKEKKR